MGYGIGPFANMSAILARRYGRVRPLSAADETIPRALSTRYVSRFPAMQACTSLSSRPARVSSFFALVIQCRTVLR